MKYTENLLQKLVVCSFIVLAGTPAKAQITPDNTLGAESSKITPNVPIGGAAADRIDGGATRGSNLFHSFSDFNINDGQRVYFGNPAGIQNILTRVTGGNASNILGTLGVDGGANLFLLNPNGIIFGQNARLDLRGSFVGTTANAIGFGEQGNFSATNPSAPPLLTVNPKALLYTQLNGGAIANGGSLSAPPGQSLVLAGGDINFNSGSMAAQGGRIELAAIAGSGTVGLNADNSLSIPPDLPRADVAVFNSQIGVTAGNNSGVAIHARNLDISGNSFIYSQIGSDAEAVDPIAGDITLDATGTVQIREGSLIANGVAKGESGKGGNINVTTSSLSLNDGAGISASTNGSGDAGSVLVQARDSVSVARNSAIFSAVASGAVGNGGNINITAPTLSLTDDGQLITAVRGASINQRAGEGIAGNVNVNVSGDVTISGVKDGYPSGIFSSLGGKAKGKGGNINITTGSLSLSDGAQLDAATNGSGDAGSVFVQARDSVSVAGSSRIFSTVESGAKGNGGNININAPTLSLTDGGQLGTFVREALNNLPAGEGNAGNVNVNVSGDVTISGVKDNQFRSGIVSDLGEGAKGKGGSINVKTGSLSLTDGAGISANTSGTGDAGSVFVQAKDFVSAAGNSYIFSDVESGAKGNGGNVNITAPTLSLTDGGQLSTSVNKASNNLPAGEGIGGKVFVDVSGNVTISGGKNGSPSGIFSTLETGAKGKGGNINVKTSSLSLTDGALITASTFGEGDAGNIQINATDRVSVSGISSSSGSSSALFTNTYPDSTGIGGDIAVNTNVLRVSDGAVLNAGTQNNSNGGNITVNARQVEAINGGQFRTSTSGSGNAGKITVNASDSVTVNGSDPTFNDRVAKFGDLVANPEAASGFFVRSQGSGIAGDIEVNSPQIRLDNGGRLIAESASGNGGNINIINSDLLLLRRHSTISTNAGEDRGAGNGGNININAKTIAAVPKENSDITANAYKGSGGQVTITTDGLFGIARADDSTPFSDITASSELGVQGQIDITEPNVQPTQGLVELPGQILDASDQIASVCPRGNIAKRPLGEFVVSGRGSLPPNPLELLPGTTSLSPLASIDGDLQANTSGQISSPPATSTTPTTIVEAQGWIKTADGKIALVASAPQATPSAPPTASACPQPNQK